MELEELKENRHVIKAPLESSGGTMDTSQHAVEGLIQMLKAEDTKQLALLKRARPLWWMAAGFSIISALGILLAKLASSDQLDPGFPLRGMLALVFSGLAVGVYLHIKRVSAIDYTEPTNVFLRKAAKRYQFMTVPYLAISILITSILAWASSMYIVDVFARYLDIHDPLVGRVASFTFVALVYLFGYHVTKKGWRKSRGPILEQIRKMQADLEGDAE